MPEEYAADRHPSSPDTWSVVRERLKAGDYVIGMTVTSNNVETGAYAATLGFHFLWSEMEHSSLSLESSAHPGARYPRTARACLRTCPVGRALAGQARTRPGCARRHLSLRLYRRTRPHRRAGMSLSPVRSPWLRRRTCRHHLACLRQLLRLRRCQCSCRLRHRRGYRRRANRRDRRDSRHRCPLYRRQ